MSIELLGGGRMFRIPPNDTVTVETPTRGANTLAIGYSGDRRLILLETDFK